MNNKSLYVLYCFSLLLNDWGVVLGIDFMSVFVCLGLLCNFVVVFQVMLLFFFVSSTQGTR